VPAIITNLIRLVEYDLAPSFIVYFICMAMGAFFVFATIFGYILYITAGVLLFAYQKKHMKWIVVCRICIVVWTVIAFVDIFIDSLIFKEDGSAYYTAMNDMLNGKDN